MNIHITGRHVDITQGMRDHIIEKFSPLKKLLAHAPTDAIDTHIVLIIEHGVTYAEVTMHIPHQPTIHAKAEAKDMYPSIDLLADKVKMQLWKHKDKELTERTGLKDIIDEDDQV